ncbi:Type I restriction enzyme EcoKI specificity protein [Megamonas hypermegale]|uniref:Type I restriction enzyme EcoKI specificity protein n=1 Tax=Megamonas hypermegale TaxID=158847 RepID=A0A239U1V5_9FIRM|nr:restriction endonuclease subunit S [Megamonas hypermegale]SNV04131.1 Type I restriction enzyme EcoKI specificity protein [Megamonas hypermegale]
MLANKLRKSVLQSAIQGKLTEQLATDDKIEDLLKAIKEEKERLIKEKKIKKQKPLPEITEEEIPFEIPKNWRWVRLDNICIYLQRGKSPTYSDIKKYPVVSQKCNQWSGFTLEPAKYLSPEVLEKYSDERYLKKHDILINSTGLGTVGRVCLFKTDSKYPIIVADSHVTVVRSTRLISEIYIKYFLSSPHIQDNIEDMCSGSTKQKELALNTIKNLLIPLPSLAEQKRIVEKLDNVLADIDELKANEEKLSILQKNFPDKLKKSILQSAIQGNLTEQLATDDKVEDLLKAIKEEKERLIKEKKIKKQKPLPEITEEEIPFAIPENWKWVRLGEIGKIIGGGTPKTTNLEYWQNGKIAWITPADMKNVKGKYISYGKKYITLLGLEKSSAQLLPKGSILFSSRAPIGYVAIAKEEVSTNQGFKSVVPFSLNLSLYLYYVLLGMVDIIKKLGTGTTFKEVSGSVVEKILVPLPPLAEQKRIVEKLDKLLADIEELKIE